MAKLTWQIIQPEYGTYTTLVAPTRALAVAIAESEWLKDNAWAREMDGTTDPDTGEMYHMPCIPTFIAQRQR